MKNLFVNCIFILVTLVLQPINVYANSEMPASKDYTVEELNTCIDGLQRIAQSLGNADIPSVTVQSLCINKFKISKRRKEMNAHKLFPVWK